MLDPTNEMVTEGDEEVKTLCLRVNNSDIDITVSFPDDLKDGKVLEVYCLVIIMRHLYKYNVYVTRLHSLRDEILLTP